MQCLLGGTPLLFSLPFYGLIALAGLLSIFAPRDVRNSPNAWCLASTFLFFGYVAGLIYGAVKSYGGNYFKLPLIGNMAEKYANK